MSNSDLARKKGSRGDSRHPVDMYQSLQSGRSNMERYAATSGVALIIPSTSDLISSFDNDKVSSIPLAYHVNCCCHTRQTGSNDEDIRSVGIPAIINRWHGIWIRHACWIKFLREFEFGEFDQELILGSQSPDLTRQL